MEQAASERSVRVNGLSLHVRSEGPEGAPWLVFSNSLLTDLGMWDGVVARLGERFRILRYDQRGHGRSQVPDGPATIEQLGDDLAALLSALDVSGAVLIGISMGFGTVLAAADAVPGRMRALMLADGTAQVPEGTGAVWRERVELARAQGMAALVGPTVERWFPAGFVEAEGPALQAVRGMIGRTPLGGYAACTHALSGYDLRAALERVSVPTLLVSGEHDGPLPELLSALARSLPGAAYAEIPGAGHLPPIDQPEAFAEAICRFLDGVPA